MDTIDFIIHPMHNDSENKLLAKLKSIAVEKNIPSRTILLYEGEVARFVYFVKQGCLRQWVNKDGKDITFQFFFEGQPVASLESFVSGNPSLFSIESIEPCTVWVVDKADFEQLINDDSHFDHEFRNFVFQRFSNYARLFLSRIKDTPQERYQELLQKQPDIIKRIPQHYIASYLGITPVSLSRIRNRK